MADLNMIDEWNISSIYYFIEKDVIPMIKRADKFILLGRYLKDHGIDSMPQSDDKIRDVFPIVSDVEDIEWVIEEWAKTNLPNNQSFYSEYIEDGNLGYVRVMLFEVWIELKPSCIECDLPMESCGGGVWCCPKCDVQETFSEEELYCRVKGINNVG